MVCLPINGIFSLADYIPLSIREGLYGNAQELSRTELALQKPNPLHLQTGFSSSTEIFWYFNNLLKSLPHILFVILYIRTIKSSECQAWWCTSITLALGTKEDQIYKASFNYTVKFYPQKEIRSSKCQIFEQPAEPNYASQSRGFMLQRCDSSTGRHLKSDVTLILHAVWGVKRVIL